MNQLKQSTAITVPFFAFDSNGDGVTGIADGSWTKRISKNGASFGAMTVTITEMENGWYSIPLSTSHTDTLGYLAVSLSATGVKRVNMLWRVSARIEDDLAFPNTSGRGMDVDASGGVEITPNQNVNVNQWLTATPNVLISGRVDSNMQALANDVITAAALAADAGGEIADAVWDEVASGHVASGSFGQALNIVRAGTAQAGASTTITLDTGASASDDFYNNNIIFITGGTGAGQSRIISDYVGSTKVATVPAWITNPDNTSVFVILPFGAIPGASAPTAAEVADAVWDEDATAHQTQGSFGQAIGDPGSDSDTIWALANTNLNATVSSRASQTSLDTLDDYVDTEVAAIKAKTDQLTFTNANKVDAAVLAAADFAQAAADKVWSSTTRTLTALGASLVQEIWDRATSALTTAGSIGKLLVDNINATISSRASQTSVDTIDDFVDTEVAAIKAKTDNLPASPAATSDIPSAATIAATVWGAADRQLTAISAGLRNQIADNVIRRTFANAAASSDGDTKTGRSLLGAIGRLTNRSRAASGVLSIYEADDTTVLFTQNLTTDGAAQHVVEADTA